MSLFDRQSDRRTDSKRKSGLFQAVESLEQRALMTTTNSLASIFGLSPQAAVASVTNSGKVVSGQDRAGNQYVISVHGPGEVIVTDVTPNDGVLMDDIDTIQIVGSNINRTSVTAYVSSSNRVTTDGMVRFENLIAQTGVKSIELNGFTLAQTLPTDLSTTTPSTVPNIYLPGGVKTLMIADIEKFNDITAVTDPFEIVIGDPSAPLKFAPSIHVGTIYNTDYNSTAVGVPAIPDTAPSVIFQVYGQTHSLTTNAITRDLPVAGQSTLFPTVGSQGMTSVATTAIRKFNAVGNVNFTRIAKAPNTLISPSTALTRAGQINVGGTADALSMSVNGTLHSLRLAKGLGNPYGTSTAATTFGTPPAMTGFPAAGYTGGQINAGAINQLRIGAANTVMQVSNSPQATQTTNGSTAYIPQPGNAMTVSAITARGSIGLAARRAKSSASGVKILGNLQQSEIASGFNYNQYVNGVSPLTGPSAIKGLKMRGSLIDSVISASYAPNTATNNFNSGASNQVDPGQVSGSLKRPGLAYYDGRGTALGRLGSGVFARRRSGALPPPNPSV